jgi:hypothetical protein
MNPVFALQNHLKDVDLRLDNDDLPLSAIQEQPPSGAAHPVTYDSDIVMISAPHLLQNIKLEDLMIDMDIPFGEFLCQQWITK